MIDDAAPQTKGPPDCSGGPAFVEYPVAPERLRRIDQAVAAAGLRRVAGRAWVVRRDLPAREGMLHSPHT